MKWKERTSTMIEAIIFDMDGLMVNSEELWEETERLYFTNSGGICLGYVLGISMV